MKKKKKKKESRRWKKMEKNAEKKPRDFNVVIMKKTSRKGNWKKRKKK